VELGALRVAAGRAQDREAAAGRELQGLRAEVARLKEESEASERTIAEMSERAVAAAGEVAGLRDELARAQAAASSIPPALETASTPPAAQSSPPDKPGFFGRLFKRPKTEEPGGQE
jgi:chromosome segregation ATPase